MKILVLAYHRVFPGHHIDPGTFEYQIQTLKGRFVPLTLDETIAFVRGELNLKKEGFAVTFDDGWADNFVYAYPILKKHNVPATIFAPTKFINETRNNIGTADVPNFTNGYEKAFKEVEEKGYSNEFLTWDDIRAMAPLITIESHGNNHLHHPKHTPEEIKKDLEISVKIIEKETGRKPKYLAWPFGEYNDSSTQIAKEIGFEACFTMKIGSVKRGDNPYKLRRFAPPRSRRWFKAATSGDTGMAIYRLAINLIKFNRFFKSFL
jgi:peptidoglycan/xylan/chitin deacetylase (PgdA/CDA1 family)